MLGPLTDPTCSVPTQLRVAAPTVDGGESAPMTHRAAHTSDWSALHRAAQLVDRSAR